MKTTEIIDFVLDLIFPRSEEELRLENMSLDAYSQLPRSTAPLPKNTYAIFSYSDPDVQKLVWLIKYKRNKKIMHLVASALYDEILGILDDRLLENPSSSYILVPIPLSKEREKERGFNQCVDLVKHVQQLFQTQSFIYIPNLLIKQRDTKPQTHLPRKERLKNVKGVFKITKPELLNNTCVIIIDDVITTGATLKEARKTLLASRARNVYCVAVAH
jgi:ComF family protein